MLATEQWKINDSISTEMFTSSVIWGSQHSREMNSLSPFYRKWDREFPQLTTVQALRWHHHKQSRLISAFLSTYTNSMHTTNYYGIYGLRVVNYLHLYLKPCFRTKLLKIKYSLTPQNCIPELYSVSVRKNFAYLWIQVHVLILSYHRTGKSLI